MRGADLAHRAWTIALRPQEITDALALGVFERWRDVLSAQSLVGPVVADRPLHIDAIGGQSLVQLVGHGAVEIAVVRPRECAEFAEIEPGVACLERIHRPPDDLDALIEAVVTLRFLELLREPAPAVRLAHREHVRVVPEVEVVDTEEAEDEPSWLRIFRRVAERHEAAVMNDGEHELGRNYHVTAPGLLLQRNRGRACRDISGHVNPEFRHE